MSHSRLLIDPILIKFRLRDDQTVEKLTIKWNNNIEKPNVKHRINPMRDLASLHKNNKVTEMSGSSMTTYTSFDFVSVAGGGIEGRVLYFGLGYVCEITLGSFHV